MNGPPPFRVLMITPTDYGRAWNNREHHMAREFAALGCDVTILYKALSRSKRWWHLLRDTVFCSVRHRCDKGIQLYRVDPFLNYFGGIRTEMESGPPAVGWRHRLRNMVVRVFSPLSCLRDIFFWPCLTVAALIRLRGTYDVAVGFGPWGSLIAWTLTRMHKTKLFLYEDRDYEPGLLPPGLRRRYTAWLERALLRRADLIVSIGGRLTELRRAQSGKAVHHISTGVNWARFASSRSQDRQGHRMIHVGNLVSWGGLEVAIQAMPLILARVADAQLLVLGGGLPAYERQLRAMVHQAGLDHVVTFLGAQPNERLPKILADAEIGLANSRPVAYRKYACPLKVLEYMAAGLPVIATEQTEAADMVNRFACGLSIPYDADAFAAAVLRVFEERGLYQQMHENAIHHSRASDWPGLFSRELDLIKAKRYGLPIATTNHQAPHDNNTPKDHDSAGCV